ADGGDALAILFAIITALAFGTGDFLGGLVSRRSPPLAVAFFSQLAGGAGLLLAVVVLKEAPRGPALLWGTAAGAITSVAFVLYLRGLSRGQMGVVSTLAAVWTALVPFAAGLAQGERPGGLALLGAVVVWLGAVLVSGGQGAPPRRAGGAFARQRRNGWQHLLRPGVLEGTLAGVGYGAGFVMLQQAGPGGAVWPALASTGATAALTGVIAWFSRAALIPRPRHWPLAAGMGLLHALATVSLVLAVQSGMLSIVSVVASMGPIPTTLLAWLLLRETLKPSQVWGVGLGLLGVALLTVA